MILLVWVVSTAIIFIQVMQIQAIPGGVRFLGVGRDHRKLPDGRP